MRLFKAKPQPALNPLDVPLLWWSNSDPFRVRDLLNGGVAIFGRSGSGKSSGSGYQLGKAIAGHRDSGGLILASKPEDRAFWQRIFAEAGRPDDLLVFEPGGALRFNFLDQIGGDTRNITNCILTIAESLKAGDGKGDGDNLFWQQQNERMIYNAVEIVRLAQGKVTAPDIQRFINSAAVNVEQLKDDAWQARYHNQAFAAAHSSPKSPVEQYDYELARDYWLIEYPTMNDRTRSSILAGVLGIMHVFNSGVVRDLVSTTTNVSPAVMEDRRWVLVDMPVMRWGETGRFILAGWKYLTQRHVLKRKSAPGEAFTVIWADEAQNAINSFDSIFMAECRSHLGCCVFLTQSIHSFYAAMKGQAGRHQADALLTNFGTKIFHALGDGKTAEFASSLLGKTLQTFIGGSMPPDDDIFDTLMGRAKVSASFSEHYEPAIQPAAFLTGMRSGGAGNGYLVDGIVIKSGEPFTHGGNALWVTFSQK
jgi:hypothetical protein